MTLILPVREATRWVVRDATDIVADGVTQLGNATGVNPALTALYGEGDAAFLAATVSEAGEYNPLPEQGGWCEGGQIYGYSGSFVICRQSHARTEHEPADIPALFSVHREDTADLEWIANEPVTVGTRRVYGGALYTCIQSHTTQTDWTPPETPALWAIVAESGNEWAAYVDYGVGDTVLYDGTEYECIQTHQSLPNWTPDATPTLWRIVAAPTDEWQAWTAYTVGDVVLYDGTEYECRQSHTSQPGWEPPNVPALWLAL